MATQSYAIYIRYPNEKTNNKCIPRQEENNNTKPIDTPSSGGASGGGSDSGGGGGFNPNRVMRAIKNPLGTLLGAASKSIPAVACVVLAAKLTDAAVETALPYYEGYTGDYRVGFNYANAKAVIGAISNPLGTVNTIALKHMEIYRENLKTEQQRLLTGNSIINTYGGRTSN